ncbi:DUF3187 family protein [Thiomicrorhabdus arctica]|uniref:DUF3187 family protein n=1 Tax=Thiomicrorhabdus arctica TaxID=131540 RepID=UPI0003610042|nr:DUF3187 family protein [Thiomicrorhabdus arctica]
MQKHLLKFSLLATLLLGNLIQVAQASDETTSSTITTKLSTGVFYSYGQSQTINASDTTTTSIPLMLSIKGGAFTFGVASSYLSIDSASFKAQGMGDTTVSMAYDLTSNPWVALKVKHKFATGDAAKALSTGKEDTSVQLDYFYPILSNTSVFANIGHKFVGKVKGANMQDTNYGSIGTGYNFANKTSLGLSLDYRQSIFKSVEAQKGASVFLSTPLTETFSASAFVGYDSTQTSNAGATITSKF